MNPTNRAQTGMYDHGRTGSTTGTVLLMLASLAALGGLAYTVIRMSDAGVPAGVGTTVAEGEQAEPLLVYCGASNRAVLEAIRAEYEREFGVPVQVQYGGSQTLMASLKVSGTGDLYMPADDSYLDLAREEGLVHEVVPLARMQAVVAVPKGNPKGIDSLDDLLAPDFRLAQASPDATAIGKLTRRELDAEGLWSQLDTATDVYKTTVNEVANDVKVGAADAGIVFDAVLATYPDLEAVELPELAPVASQIAVGVLDSSEQPTQALHFVRYLSARDRGLKHYKELGFRPVEGDPWEDQPELTLYAGSMLRPAIEETVREFEQREGVRVTRVYNGCGILVAQMKAGQVPDAYFACDSQFMDMVTDLFPKSESISQNELVILVQKGNPHHIRSLQDLGKQGLRVGIGHEKQCAMGWITQQTFEQGGVTDAVMKNVVVQTPTGDMLVNQLRTGSLDAAVVYLSNAAGAADALDAVRIVGLPCAIAIQPYGTAQASGHRQLSARLLERIHRAESRERFLNNGFVWKAGDAEASADE